MRVSCFSLVLLLWVRDGVVMMDGGKDRGGVDDVDIPFGMGFEGLAGHGLLVRVQGGGEGERGGAHRERECVFKREWGTCH